MLFELLMPGEDGPQVIAFILEQENHYIAPHSVKWRRT
jgi:hypothetical protein